MTGRGGAVCIRAGRRERLRVARAVHRSAGAFALLAGLVWAIVVATAPLAAQEPRTLDVGDLGAAWGNADAPIQVVEFTDPACPYCAEFHVASRDSLFRYFVEPGHVRWITIPWVSGLYGNSALASAAVECLAEGGPDAFEEMFSGLYRTRDEWVRISTDGLRDHLARLAEVRGMPGDELVRCLDRPDIRRRVEASRALGLEEGVRGTPTYFLDGFPLMGALPWPFVRRMFDQRMEEVGRR